MFNLLLVGLNHRTAKVDVRQMASFNAEQLPQGLRLVESLAQLRRGRILPPERKVLIALDQFEQWLHAKRGEEGTELIAALRHCDGEHVQAIVTVPVIFGSRFS